MDGQGAVLLNRLQQISQPGEDVSCTISSDSAGVQGSADADSASDVNDAAGALRTSGLNAMTPRAAHVTSTHTPSNGVYAFEAGHNGRTLKTQRSTVSRDPQARDIGLEGTAPREQAGGQADAAHTRHGDHSSASGPTPNVLSGHGSTLNVLSEDATTTEVQPGDAIVPNMPSSSAVLTSTTQNKEAATPQGEAWSTTSLEKPGWTDNPVPPKRQVQSGDDSTPKSRSDLGSSVNETPKSRKALRPLPLAKGWSVAGFPTS